MVYHMWASISSCVTRPAKVVHEPEEVLRVGLALLGRAAVPSDGFDVGVSAAEVACTDGIRSLIPIDSGH